jgi:hypothetical protein
MPSDPEQAAVGVSLLLFTLGGLAVIGLAQYEMHRRPGAFELYPFSLEAVPTILGGATGLVAIMGGLPHAFRAIPLPYPGTTDSWLANLPLATVLALAVVTPILMWAPRAVRRVRGPPADVDE